MRDSLFLHRSTCEFLRHYTTTSLRICSAKFRSVIIKQ